MMECEDFGIPTKGCSFLGTETRLMRLSSLSIRCQPTFSSMANSGMNSFVCSFSISLFGNFYILNRFGTDTFNEVMKLATRIDNAGVDWNKFKYMIFDIPNHSGTYADRYQELGIHFIPFLRVNLCISIIYREAV